MPVTNQIPRNVSTAAPAATAFPYDFKITSKGDLLVQVDGVTKTVDVDYELTGVGLDAGGEINFFTPMVGGEVVMRKRDMLYIRQTDYQNLGDLRSSTLNNDQDAPVMMLQQLADSINRSLQLPLDTPVGADGTLPSIEPLKPLIGNAGGTGFEFGDTSLTGDMLLRPNLAAAGGYSFVNFKPAGSVGNGVANDTAALNAAIALNKQFYLPTGDYLVTSITNDLGLDIEGDGRILKAITGGYQQLNTRVDRNQHVTGREYLFHWTETLRTTSTALAVCSGDSTTESGGLAPAYLFHQYIKYGAYNAGFKVDSINAGHSSMDTSDWVASYLTADLALNPDLYVVRWGINDPFNGRTLDEFVASLRAGLTQCRAAKTVSQMSILLCVPNTTGDTPNGRDEKWYEQMRLAIHQAGRDFQCCVIDLYAMFKDPRNGASAWLDNPFADGRGIHPTSSFAIQIGSAVNDVLYPQNLLPKLIESSLFTKDVSALPSTYPVGTSVYNSPNPGAWPIQNAVITTHRSADGNLTQFCMSTNSADFGSAASNGGLNLGQIAIRSGVINAAGTVNGWHKWVTEPSISLAGYLVNGWVIFNGDCAPRAMKSNNVVTLSGMIKDGTITDGTTLFTLPVGYRPRQNPEFALAQIGTTAAVVPCSIRILSSGVVSIMDGGVAGFLSLTGISFEAGS